MPFLYYTINSNTGIDVLYVVFTRQQILNFAVERQISYWVARGLNSKLQPKRYPNRLLRFNNDWDKSEFGMSLRQPLKCFISNSRHDRGLLEEQPGIHKN